MDEFERWRNESTVVSLPGMEDLFLCNHQPSISAVLRGVKKREHGLFNCVASIVHDSVFVREIAGETGFPVFGNLRCGAWYTREQDMDGTCYFKSTDGHTGQWSFSLTRLNLHVAEKAVRCGGCVIVDATRRGKRYPDALSKTVPVWAHVLNTAVAIYQREHGMPCMEESNLCLPEWVSEHEEWQIEQRVAGWCEDLLQSGVDVSGLAKEMCRPFKVCWIDQDKRDIPENTEGEPMILLVSASQYGVRERLSLPQYPHVVFDYIPGAGDDEESWACGLTPSIFWKHCDVILNTEPADVIRVVKTLVQKSNQSGVPQSDPGVQWVPNTNMGMVSMAYVSSRDDFCIDDTMAIVNLSGHDLTAMVGDESMETCACTSIAGGGMLSRDNHIVQLRVNSCLKNKGSIPRHLWLPRVLGKHLVVCACPAAVEFASLHLAHGRSVLFVHDHTQSWCGPLAAALLLTTLVACFSFSQDDAWVRVADYAIDTQGARLYPAVEHASKDMLSRDIFKRYVAKSVGQYLPHIVMRKDILKQVFNVFIPRAM